MTEPGRVEPSSHQDTSSDGAGLSENVVAIAIVVGLFFGLGLAVCLLVSKGQIPRDVGDAASALLPFAVVWGGLIVGTNQLLKATGSIAKDAAAKAQITVYEGWIAKWNQLWPILTTSISVGYFMAVLADENPVGLGLFLAFLIFLVFLLALATTAHLKKSRPDGSAAERDEWNTKLVVRPLLILSYLIPVTLIVVLSAVALDAG